MLRHSGFVIRHSLVLFPALASADVWSLRPLYLGPPATPLTNTDVLPTPAGLSVGYTAGSTLTLATLSTSPLPTRQSTSTPVTAATFAADPFGSVYFAAGSSPNLRVGADASPWSLGLLDSPHPNSSLSQTALPVITTDAHALPALLATDTAGQHILSRFDPATSTWSDTTLPTPTTPSQFFQGALAFTPDNRPAVAYITPTSLLVAVQSSSGVWLQFQDLGPADPARGLSLTTLPDNSLAVAYNSPSAGLQVSTFDNNAWSTITLSPTPAALLPHSLATDPTGQLALAYAPASSLTAATPLHISRLTTPTWSDETLPFRARAASLAFDPANHPYAALTDGANILLAGTALPAFLKNDFTLDGQLTTADVPPLVQSIVHPSTFLSTHPNFTPADVVTIADRTDDLQVTRPDARLFADSLPSSNAPLTRTAAYTTLDQSDADPTIGTGAGNFFSTTLSTHAPYTAGSSRADFNTDETVDYKDADALVSVLSTGNSQLATGNSIYDINADGLLTRADLQTLLHDILHTTEGDANLDGVLNADDYALLDRGFSLHLPGYSNGDFNADGTINSADYLLLDTAYAQSHGLSPDFLSQRESEFGPDYVSALLTSIPEPTLLSSILCPLSVFFLFKRRKIPVFLDARPGLADICPRPWVPCAARQPFAQFVSTPPED